MRERSPHTYFRRFNLREALILALFGGMIVATKLFIRIPLKLPGHSTAFMMFFLVLGKGLVPAFGSGMTMGLFSGILAALTGMGKQGAFVLVKFLLPGLALDLLAAPVMRSRYGSGALSNPVVGAVLGMLVNLAKLAGNIALARALDLPLEQLELVVGVAIVSHVCFGIVGGIVASLALGRLRRLMPSLLKVH